MPKVSFKYIAITRFFLLASLSLPAMAEEPIVIPHYYLNQPSKVLPDRFAGLGTPDTSQFNLNMDEQLELEFVFNEPPVAATGEIDVIWFSAGASFINFDGGTIEFFVFDDEEQLSFVTFDFPVTCCFYVDTMSPFNFNNNPVFDFSSIVDASIKGRYIIRPHFATDFDPQFPFGINYSPITILTGRLDQTGSLHPGPTPTVTSCFIKPNPFGDSFEDEPLGNSCMLN